MRPRSLAATELFNLGAPVRERRASVANMFTTQEGRSCTRQEALTSAAMASPYVSQDNQDDENQDNGSDTNIHRSSPFLPQRTAESLVSSRDPWTVLASRFASRQAPAANF